MRAAGERPEFNIKPTLWAPQMIFSQGYLLKPFLKGILQQDRGGLKSEFSLA